jgi:hypothetical protein
MDDARWQNLPEALRTECEERLLSSLGKTQAFLFASGKPVDNTHGAGILRRWSEAGHRIGNHTYSHPMLSKDATPEQFEAGILQAEEVLRKAPGFRKWFRFPFLKEGRTRADRDHVRAFLGQHGYRNGAVTIDASDWYYDTRLRQRLEAEAGFDRTRFRQPYLDHIWDRAQFYDRLSRDVLGRSVSHTLLIHYNLLNSMFLGDLLAMFRSRGWAVTDAEEAFKDEVFKLQPDIAS